MLKYDTLEQARFRLNGTLITYKGTPYCVQEANKKGSGPIRLTLQALPLQRVTAEDVLGETITVDQDDPDLNFRIFRLGYCNLSYDRRAIFYTRAPARQQHQGLTGQTIHPQMANRHFWSKDMTNLLLGVYPTIEEAFKRINDNWVSCAISRDFAIGRSEEIPQLRTLLYRGRNVGVALGQKFQHFLINENDEYLAEALQEAGFPFEVDKNE